jgi:peroxiredoxin
MIQAEIGAARCNEEGTYPTKGLRVRDFEFFNTNGQSVHISDFRGKTNLVLLFLGAATDNTLDFARELEARCAQFEQRDSKVLLAFMATSKHLTAVRSTGSIIVLTDMDSRAHQQFGACDNFGRPEQACYITDRFGEVYFVSRTIDGNIIPTIESMLEWLDFIEAQCPECEAPEWPLDAA